MSDFDSSLPVRTQNNGDVVVKVGDGTLPSQFLAVDSSGKVSVKLDDGSGTAITSQANGGQRALDVGINVAGVQIDPRSIRALTSSDVVSVVQSTSPWVVKDQADGPVTPGTVASFSMLVGGQYNSSLPTLTTGQQSAVQLDASGRLITVSASSDDHNYGTVGATTLRTAAQIGNATGAASFNTGATGAQTLRVEANQGASATAANGWFVKLTDGTNNAALTAAGELKTNDNLTQVGGAAIALGQTTMSASLPVTIASNQTDLGVKLHDGADNSITSQVNGAQRALDVGINVAGVQIDPRQIRTLTSTDVVTANIKDSSGNAFSPSNPLPVTIDTVSGTAVTDYKDASAIAAAGSDNHDYTVTAAKTLYLSQIISSASGKAKMVLSIETGVATGVFTTKLAQFNSTAEANMNITLEDSIVVAAGVRVRVTMTNRDLVAQDLYSTICGHEV